MFTALESELQKAETSKSTREAEKQCVMLGMSGKKEQMKKRYYGG